MHPVDLARILPHIRFAVLNGNYATTLDVLAAGKPCRQVPLTTEHAPCRNVRRPPAPA